MAILGAPSPPLAADACDDAPAIGDGTFGGDTTGADTDGTASCGLADSTHDVWWRYVAPADGTVVAQIVDVDYETLLSVHTSCPGRADNLIACDAGELSGVSTVTFHAAAGEEVLIRASGFAGDTGPLALLVGRLGVVSGTVNRGSTGEPLANAVVTLYNQRERFVTSGATDAAGGYALEVPPGTYFATAHREGFVDELYEERFCDTRFAVCRPISGTPIEVTTIATTVPGIDFTLDLGGVVAGRVTDAASGNPLAGAEISVWNDLPRIVSTGFTDRSGHFAAENLASGTYFVSVMGSHGFLDEIYDDIPCPGGLFSRNCNVLAGAPVEVAVEATTAGIDFALERMGAISGTVVAATGGEPIPGIGIEVYDDLEAYVGFAVTDASGSYTVGGLAAGTHFVVVPSPSGFLGELYDDISCPQPVDCPASSGTPVEVTAGATTTGIGFALSGLGSISGTVTAAATGEPIAGIEVVVFDGNGRDVNFGFTDSKGQYRTGGVPSGTFFVTTVNALGFFDELYDDIPCGNGGGFEGCDPLLGTPVEVAFEKTTTGIDFALVVNGSLSGRVTDQSTGQGLRSEIRVSDASGDLISTRSTDASGFFSVINLVPGTYYVDAASVLYLGELYDDIPCPEPCDPTTGTPIQVSLSADTPGVDFSLRRLGAISGTVTDVATDVPIESLIVDAWNPEGRFVGLGRTDRFGHYTINGLLPGTYFATTRDLFPGFPSRYHDELYDDLPCPQGIKPDSCDPTAGTPVAVGLSTTTSGIDFALELATGIEGTVTDESTGAPVSGIFVDVWNRLGRPVARTVSGTGGRYSASTTYGVFLLSTDNQRGALDEVYDDIPCPDGPVADGLCDLQSGTFVTVDSGQVSRGVDIALEDFPCVPTSTSLCLNRGRFRVEVAWEDANGNRGSGQAVELTSDSGYFWFFSPDNVELVVKLLDGCFDPFDSFWFFTAGLTNVAVEVTVTDTTTDEVKRYVSPLGTAFEPILDTAAFATCDAAVERPASPRAAPPQAGKGPTCSPGANGLCLGGRRFLVEAFWRTREGRTGEGHGVELTADTGYFWFFSRDNVETVVKVLDACDFEPFHDFWVFAAGLTNVEVTLRVTDTVSGAVQEYENPLGRSFRPVLDTHAFATCPE